MRRSLPAPRRKWSDVVPSGQDGISAETGEHRSLPLPSEPHSAQDVVTSGPTRAKWQRLFRVVFLIIILVLACVLVRCFAFPTPPISSTPPILSIDAPIRQATEIVRTHTHQAPFFDENASLKPVMTNVTLLFDDLDLFLGHASQVNSDLHNFTTSFRALTSELLDRIRGSNQTQEQFRNQSEPCPPPSDLQAWQSRVSAMCNNTGVGAFQLAALDLGTKLNDTSRNLKAWQQDVASQKQKSHDEIYGLGYLVKEGFIQGQNMMEHQFEQTRRTAYIDFVYTLASDVDGVSYEVETARRHAEDFNAAGLGGLVDDCEREGGEGCSVPLRVECVEWRMRDVLGSIYPPSHRQAFLAWYNSVPRLKGGTRVMHDAARPSPLSDL